MFRLVKGGSKGLILLDKSLHLADLGCLAIKTSIDVLQPVREIGNRVNVEVTRGLESGRRHRGGVAGGDDGSGRGWYWWLRGIVPGFGDGTGEAGSSSDLGTSANRSWQWGMGLSS